MTLMEPIKPATTAGITCTVVDLRRAVNAAAFVVKRRNTIPVLGCLRITPRDGLLEIEATDLDSWLTVDCDATCAAADPFLLDAFVLRALLVGAETGDSISIDRAADIVTMRIRPTTIRLRLPEDREPSLFLQPASAQTWCLHGYCDAENCPACSQDIQEVAQTEAVPVAWTGNGSLMALADGREGFMWPAKADAHPIPLFAAPPAPDIAEAARVLASMPGEAWGPAVNAMTHIFRRDMDVTRCPSVSTVRDALFAALRALSEGDQCE